jgi:hypothetical protein
MEARIDGMLSCIKGTIETAVHDIKNITGRSMGNWGSGNEAYFHYRLMDGIAKSGLRLKCMAEISYAQIEGGKFTFPIDRNPRKDNDGGYCGYADLITYDAPPEGSKNANAFSAIELKYSGGYNKKSIMNDIERLKKFLENGGKAALYIHICTDNADSIKRCINKKCGGINVNVKAEDERIENVDVFIRVLSK